MVAAAHAAEGEPGQGATPEQQEVQPQLEQTSQQTLPSATLTTESLTAFFDSAFAVQTKAHRMVGAVISVVQGDQILFKKGYGWADLEQRITADPDRSLFRIASISKPFIWTALMQLVEQGRLALDDEVNDYLTDFKIPDTWPEPVRIRHLLTHTAGFEDRAIGMGASSLATVRPLGAYLEENMPARVRPPGQQASYSNWGTALAGYVIEQISGQSWADYVDENVLAPLDMQSTSTRNQPAAEFEQRLATAYSWAGGRFVPQPYQFMNDGPAGVISTTADDMTRFMRAHLNYGTYNGKRILREETARRMQLPLFDPHPGIVPMLHGFYRSDRNGQVIFGHGGDTNQFHSNLSLFPEHRLGVFISFNSDPSAAARVQLITAFVDHFFPAPYLRKPPAAIPFELNDYVGEYIPLRSNQSTIERLGILVTGLNISASDGELVLGGGSRWIPQGADRFIGRYTDRWLVFERDGDAVSHVLIGEPLNTFRRVDGLDAPGNIRILIISMLLIGAAGVLGYGYRGIVRAPLNACLPLTSVLFGWSHALLLTGLYLYLGYVLSGDVEAFIDGVPKAAHVSLILLSFNTLIGGVVIVLAVLHWLRGYGSLASRMRYSALGLAAIANLWVAWYFNLLSYPITGV